VSVLCPFCKQILLLNCEDFESDSWSPALASAAAVLLMSSTYGPGAPPASAAKFIAWLNRFNSKITGTQSTLIGNQWWCVDFARSSLLHLLT